MNAIEPITDSVENTIHSPRPISAVMVELLAHYGLQAAPYSQGAMRAQCPKRQNLAPYRKTGSGKSAAFVRAAGRKLTA